jgi:hypothetical protein
LSLVSATLPPFLFLYFHHENCNKRIVSLLRFCKSHVLFC